MADAFAGVADLEGRWRTLTAEERNTAHVLLGDASAIVRGEVPDIDARLGAVPPTLDADIPKFVVCGMVKRAMMSVDVEGISSAMDVAGPFTQQRSYANPQGNLYLNKQDKRLLGYRGQKAFTVDLVPPDAGSPPGWSDW